MGPILKIDLASRTLSKLEIPRAWEEDYLGGASLAARWLYADLRPECEPLSPAAPLLFLNGPLSGTSGPAVGRFVVCGRSPATGLWGESNCGGFWGVELRKAGYTGLLLTGRAPQPVYLYIHHDQVEFRPAEHLWGLDTYATQAALESELSPVKARLAVIGPAGEAQIPAALILVDHGRVAGRTGMGAVMGSKNIKAIAVRGHNEIPVARPDRYAALRSEANRALRADSLTEVLRALGTASVADYFDYLGEMPKRYFQRGEFEGASQVSGATVADTILSGVSACHACVIACGRVVKLADGAKRKGPEYETLVGFGPNLLLGEAAFATLMGEECDRFGVDSISLSNTIGLAFQLYEAGLIPDKDTSGISLQWGDPQAVKQLVRQTVRGEGLGRLIRQGALALARHYGVPEAAVQVNGLEVAYHDPRGASGMALVYATSPRGACHNQSDYFLVDVGQAESSLGLQIFSPQAGAEKAANVALHQDWRTVYNSLVMCIFANVAPAMIADLVNTALDLEYTPADLMQVGARGWNLKRVINNRLGLTAANDRLPEALLQPYPDRSPAFVPEFEAMKRAYYQARDWDPLTGIPRRDKLLALGLDFVLDDLYL